MRLALEMNTTYFNLQCTRELSCADMAEASLDVARLRQPAGPVGRRHRPSRGGAVYMMLFRAPAGLFLFVRTLVPRLLLRSVGHCPLGHRGRMDGAGSGSRATTLSLPRSAGAQSASLCYGRPSCRSSSCPPSEALWYSSDSKAICTALLLLLVLRRRQCLLLVAGGIVQSWASVLVC
ncbi:hypothetical protein BS78_06G210100 [Paspalum vaginatum]|nr:hypothetical protein BS78_06G210100 [Paspalum vaginatum]